MKYKNPILLCDYSDPDICRVGSDFFLTASSFNFVPGLPILHSRDLIHWRLVNYALPAIPLAGYEKVQNAKGVWAPSIRFHDGKFFIFFATPDEGIFFTSAEDPFGKWSELQCVWSGREFEDPCPLWDDDGKVWLVHAYVKSRIGFNSKLGLLKLDPKTFKTISEDKIIFDGTKTQPTIEGPKFYKRNGFYYIFAPAGGVTNGWQTVLRSKRIDGDYEEKIVLAQGTSRINGPHQGGWVTTESGEDWFVHFQDAGIFGRITHLQPMRWIDDWCVMGSEVALADETALSVVGEPVDKWEVPKIWKESEKRHGQTRMDADTQPVIASKSLVIASVAKQSISEFQTSANPSENAFATTGKSLWRTPSVCTKKIDSKKFTYEKEFSLAGEWHEAQRKGIIFLGNEYAALQIEKSADGFVISYLESSGSESGDDERSEKILWSEEISRQARNDNFNDSPARNNTNVSPECVGGANLSALKSKNEKSCERITLKMKFKASKDGKSGTVRFFAKVRGFGKSISFKSKPFSTTNAHWVGGRFGWF